MFPCEISLKTLLCFIAVMAVLCSTWWLVARSNDEPRAVTPKFVETPEKFVVRSLRETLQKRFASSDSITFLSWNGRWIGADWDTEVKLTADGSVRLTEYSDAIDTYEGTYSIISDSDLILTLKGYPRGWPKMRVYQDQSALLLTRADGSSDATQNGSRWPFRQAD